MKRRNWAWLAGSFVAIPAVFTAMALMDAIFELGVLHSTWQSGIALFGTLSVGLFFLWQVKLRARWQHILLMLAYAPAMFAALAWLGLFIQFNFDGCMVQQAVAADRPKTGAG
jgi:hypothetical protein